jgi:hypothetical protein
MYHKCRHVMPNGNQCSSPALKSTYFCYFHTRLHRAAKEPAPATNQPLKLPILEDRSAIQVALSQVLNALGSSKLDARLAGIFLYGLQIASQNVERHYKILETWAVESITQTSDGDELAPDKRVCLSIDDCSTCDERENCDDYDPSEENDEEEEDEE